MSGVHLAACFNFGRDISILLIASTAPEPGERWDPEDGPRPRTGILAHVFQEVPVCSCKGHVTCDKCGVSNETEIARIWARGPHYMAYWSLFEQMREIAAFSPLFEGGARLFAQFKGDELIAVRRIVRRKARYTPIHTAIFG